jgi:hypothetical protein
MNSISSRTWSKAGGKLDLVRQVARTRVMRVIDGLPLTPQTATLLLAVYNRLSVYDQEEFAAGCNLSFWQSAQQLLSVTKSDSKGVTVVFYAKS